MLDIRDALAAEVADKHDVILTLKRDVQVLEEQCKKADQQTHFKDDIIKELRKEIKLLKSEVRFNNSILSLSFPIFYNNISRYQRTQMLKVL